MKDATRDTECIRNMDVVRKEGSSRSSSYFKAIKILRLSNGTHENTSFPTGIAGEMDLRNDSIAIVERECLLKPNVSSEAMPSI